MDNSRLPGPGCPSGATGFRSRRVSTPTTFSAQQASSPGACCPNMRPVLHARAAPPPQQGSHVVTCSEPDLAADLPVQEQGCAGNCHHHQVSLRYRHHAKQTQPTVTRHGDPAARLHLRIDASTLHGGVRVCHSYCGQGPVQWYTCVYQLASPPHAVRRGASAVPSDPAQHHAGTSSCRGASRGLACPSCNRHSTSLSMFCKRLQESRRHFINDIRFHNIALYLGFAEDYIGAFLREHPAAAATGDCAGTLFYLLLEWKKHVHMQNGSEPSLCLAGVLRMAGEPDLADLYDDVLADQQAIFHSMNHTRISSV